MIVVFLRFLYLIGFSHIALTSTAIICLSVKVNAKANEPDKNEVILGSPANETDPKKKTEMVDAPASTSVACSHLFHQDLANYQMEKLAQSFQLMLAAFHFPMARRIARSTISFLIHPVF